MKMTTRFHPILALMAVLFSTLLLGLSPKTAYSQAGVNSLDVSLQVDTPGNGMLTYVETLTVDPVAADSGVQSSAWNVIQGGAPDTGLFSDWCDPEQADGAYEVNAVLNVWPAQMVAQKPVTLYDTKAGAVPRDFILTFTVPGTESYQFGSLVAAPWALAVPIKVGPAVTPVAVPPTPGTATTPPPAYVVSWTIANPAASGGMWSDANGDTSNSVTFMWTVSAPASAPAKSIPIP